MDTFEQDMEEDQPLDLSMKTGSRSSSPSRRQKRRGEESPLCLIKDCGCYNHQPRMTYPGSEYMAPVSCTSQSAQDVDEANGEGRCFDHRVNSNICEQRQWEMRSAFRENTGLDGSQRGSGHVEHSSARISPPARYYNDNAQKPHYLLDLSNVHTTSGTDWKLNGNNEATTRRFADDREGPYWNNSEPNWSSSNDCTSNSHWRPFADVADANKPAADDRSIGNIGRSAADVRAIEDANRLVTKVIRTAPNTSRFVTVTAPDGLHFGTENVFSFGGGVFSQAPSSTFSSSGGSSSALTSCSASVPTIPASEPVPRTICHSFASTVPLISNSSVGAISSSKSLTLSRTPSPAMRVTRSPKTFHNEVVRADADVRGCPFLRPQDSRRLPAGRVAIKEKENLEMLEPGFPEGVKMPALDYLISKVLVERVDIPFKPCNTEIKKIYNGERKGRLRLVDLIELQVEESLKA